MYADRRLRREIRQHIYLNAYQDENLDELTELTGNERGVIARELFDKALAEAVHAAKSARQRSQVRVPLSALITA